MGVVELDRGNYEAALAYDEQALQVDREMGNKEGIARNLGNIGTVYRAMGEWEKALIYYDQAIPLHRQLSTKYHLCETLIRKAQLLLGQGRVVEASQLHAEGSQIAAEVALILLVPILVPVLNIVDIDLIHFGVLMTLNLMIGCATPPVGVSLFVVSHITETKVERLMRAILPFLVPPIIVLFLITYIPSLVTWIPDMAFGK